MPPGIGVSPQPMPPGIGVSPQPMPSEQLLYRLLMMQQGQ